MRLLASLEVTVFARSDSPRDLATALGDVLRKHQREDVRQTVRCIADLVRQGHNDDELLDLLVPD